MTSRSARLLAIAREAGELAKRKAELDERPLASLEAAAQKTARSWSRSNLGYQANVYYEGFGPPPAGAFFSREWGFLGIVAGTKGEWRSFRADEVEAHIEALAGHPDLCGPSSTSEELRPVVDALIHRARSNAAKIPPPHDDYLKETLQELSRVSLPSVKTLAEALMSTTSGVFAVRDTQALEGGWQPSAHQIALARVMHIRSPYAVATRLAAVCERLGRHLEGEGSMEGQSLVQLGQKVFIGHGGASMEYLRLGVWLTDRGLEWEVFDRVPTAGLSTKERLLEMLDNAQFAFLFLTPEDEDAEGKMNARANVIHEVGLFQGRLGWTKAIVLLESGCEEFSNIKGIGQIRYPRGNIRAAFDEIRQVLEREGVQ